MISWPSSSFDEWLFLIDNRNTGSVPRPHSGRGFSCPMTGHDRGYGSADVVGSDTRRQLPQVKSRYIFRSTKGGNCLGSVGRWVLLKQALRSFSALKPLKWAYYRGFRAGDSGIFEKIDPNCHSWRCQFGAQSGKTDSVASRPWAIASRFRWKMKKSADNAFISEKLFIFAAWNTIRKIEWL